MYKAVKQCFIWVPVLAVCAGIFFVGWSGTRTQEFVEPLHNAFLEAAQKNDERSINLQEFTDFEWDRLDVLHGYASVFSVWDRGIPWLRYTFEQTHHEAQYLWIFRKNGIVTRFTSTVSVPSFGPESPAHYLPRLPSEYRSLLKDETVFELVHLKNADDFLTGSPIEWDMMIPVNSTTSENSWRGVFEKCIHENSVYDECKRLAYQENPFMNSPSWPK